MKTITTIRNLFVTMLICIFIYFHVDERNVITRTGNNTLKAEMAYRKLIRDIKVCDVYYKLDYMWINL